MRVLELAGSMLVVALLGAAASCGGSEFSGETGGSSGTAGSSIDGSLGTGGGAGSGGQGSGGGDGSGGSNGSGGADGSGGAGGSGGNPGGSGGNPTGGSGGGTSGSGGNPTGGSGGGTSGSGGNPTGGSGGGTSGSGGNPTGGSGGGTSGSGGGGTGGSGGVPPECRDDGDCRLHTDCCTCTGIPKGQALVHCTDTCLLDQCTSMGITKAICYKGQCIASADCDLGHAICGGPTPQCDPGEVNTIVGGCYGPCVDPSDCKYVTDCAACKDSQVCATYTKGATTVLELRCLDVPAACTTSRTCACLGSYACVDPHNVCALGQNTVRCDCPSC